MCQALLQACTTTDKNPYCEEDDNKLNELFTVLDGDKKNGKE